MASVFGFSEVLLTQKLEPAEQKELLEIVYGQSLAMSEILNELLDLARIEARRGKDFRFNYVCAQTLITELSKSIKIPSGRLAPVLMLPAQEAWLMADTGKLKQALGNVINNAYKYSPGGGAVEVRLEMLPATLDAPERIQVQVSDYGMGMTADQTRRVFERFFRADTSGKIPGTGLGMSIVKEIVELHQGQVQVTSHVGQGTTVTMTFSNAAQTPVTA
jgi:signal transduction histidine kinase